ncbi:TetR/AcrR family transcriptional regulator [Gordonia sp. PKS22-38]|uniref:TetR/AcrR family transcriptional regulator n=1 Tax=Gordonia prachuapensis TaxID=3115651 RepID=A0ABU7MM93_9ACTN|nr:TetR/AcrR family transcriptional regulator [Gordonia sp. PKS22-38]
MASPKTRRTSTNRRPRGSISADEIITGAFEVANQVSLAEFSMPLLAKHLDVGVTSIYWYFRKKEDLLDAMSEKAGAEYQEATPFEGADDWQDALRRHFRRMHRTFRAQPVMVELTLLRVRNARSSPASLEVMAEKLETIIASLVSAGFTRDGALEVYLSLLAHVCGSAMLEHFGVFTGSEADPDGTVRPNDPLIEALSTRGHHIDNVNERTFEFIFEAILLRAEAMLSDHRDG